MREDDPIIQIPSRLRASLLPFGGERLVAGLRYDFSLLAALKAEFHRDLQKSRKGINAGFFQFSFTF